MGDGFGGYAKRTASRYGQFVTQNALSAVGNTLLGFEPRYNRCQCTGFWPRTRHAFVRNFVTYDRTERHLRPQLALVCRRIWRRRHCRNIGTRQSESAYGGLPRRGHPSHLWNLRQLVRRIRTRLQKDAKAKQIRKIRQ
jgi:hypothetical protein